MVKIETLTFEYTHCGGCPNSDYGPEYEGCQKTGKAIPNIWGEIPPWCPLENKKEDE